MKARSYLMSFEQMTRLLQENGISIDSRLVMNFPTQPSRLMCSVQRVFMQDDLLEKFFGTWWEVEIPSGDQMPSRCLYLADSLQDAFRLRPDIDTTYWCNVEDPFEFLAEVSSWQEDDYFGD